jgi:UDP-glucose 4-epimerase
LVLGPTTDQFYSRLLNWPVLPLVAGRNPPLQFVHEDDVGRAYEQTLMNGAEGIFNIVGSGIVSWKDVIVTAGKCPVRMPRWLVCSLLKLLWGLRLVETPADVLDFVTYPWVASGEKARKGLGFSPTYSSEQTLRAFLAARGKI